MAKKVMIVFEETGFSVQDSTGRKGKGFNVYLDGDVAGDEVKEEDLSTAQWWALKMFRIVAHYLGQAGSITSIQKKEKDGLEC